MTGPTSRAPERGAEVTVAPAPPQGGRARKTVAASRVEISRLMRPQDGNFAGNVHGGILLGLMDEVAYLCASRYAETYCVTAAVDQVDFHSPVRVGDLVTLRASVNRVGTSSMEVGISIVAENPRDPSSGRRTNRCFFTMVALDESGRPIPVPELVHETTEDEKWRCEAELRRELRRRYRDEIEKGACTIETASATSSRAAGRELSATELGHDHAVG